MSILDKAVHTKFTRVVGGGAKGADSLTWEFTTLGDVLRPLAVVAVLLLFVGIVRAHKRKQEDDAWMGS